MSVEDWSLFYWSIFIVSLFAYIIFLRGLYFLRKMARFLLTNKYFSDNTIENLKKSGNNFLYTGIISFALIVVLWISKLTGGKFELIIHIKIYKKLSKNVFVKYTSTLPRPISCLG